MNNENHITNLGNWLATIIIQFMLLLLLNLFLFLATKWKIVGIIIIT